MAVIKKIRPLIDIILNTKIESRKLNAEEITLVRFSTEQEFRALLTSRLFVETNDPTPVVIDRPETKEEPKEESKPEPEVEQNIVVEDVQIDSEICPKCGTPMILTSNKGKSVYFCPKCNEEKEPEKEPPSKVKRSSKAKIKKGE